MLEVRKNGCKRDCCAMIHKKIPREINYREITVLRKSMWIDLKHGFVIRSHEAESLSYHERYCTFSQECNALHASEFSEVYFGIFCIACHAIFCADLAATDQTKLGSPSWSAFS